MSLALTDRRRADAGVGMIEATYLKNGATRHIVIRTMYKAKEDAI
jgi:hypothetical protein